MFLEVLYSILPYSCLAASSHPFDSQNCSEHGPRSGWSKNIARGSPNTFYLTHTWWAMRYTHLVSFLCPLHMYWLNNNQTVIKTWSAFVCWAIQDKNYLSLQPFSVWNLLYLALSSSAVASQMYRPKMKVCIWIAFKMPMHLDWIYLTNLIWCIFMHKLNSSDLCNSTSKQNVYTTTSFINFSWINPIWK